MSRNRIVKYGEIREILPGQYFMYFAVFHKIYKHHNYFLLLLNF